MLRHLTFLGILLPFLWGWWGGQVRAQEDIPTLIRKIKPAVVTVIGYNGTGNVIRLGSGFFVNANGHLITSRHVIHGVARAELKLPKGERYPLTTVLAEDRQGDLIKLSVNIPPAVPPICRQLTFAQRWENMCWWWAAPWGWNSL